MTTLFWGGFDGNTPLLADGGRYSPVSNSWSGVSIVNAPAARTDHTAVWTGSEMIVWGGSSGGPFYLDSGGRFEPVSGTWSQTPTTHFRHSGRANAVSVDGTADSYDPEGWEFKGKSKDVKLGCVGTKNDPHYDQ